LRFEIAPKRKNEVRPPTEKSAAGSTFISAGFEMGLDDFPALRSANVNPEAYRQKMFVDQQPWRFK
jgi:hypothetical protein